MLFRDVIELIGIQYSENDVGDTLELESPRLVFANKKSVRQSEFYQAAQTGLQPELMFEVRSADYEGEEKLSFEGKSYTIIRIFEKPSEFTELICTGTVGD